MFSKRLANGCVGGPAKSSACRKAVFFFWVPLCHLSTPHFQRSYMGGPMSMRDFEDDEITTNNMVPRQPGWDLVGDDPMP